MKRSIQTRLAVAAAMILSCAGATTVRADEPTDAKATEIFDQLDVGGLYKDNWLTLEELTGDKLKWLQYDTNYNNHVEKSEFLAGYARGVPQLRPTDAEALKIFQQRDTDRDGYLRSDGADAKYKAYDLRGDNILSAIEFLNGYAKEHGPADQQGQPGQAAPASPAVPAPAAAPPAPAAPAQWQEGDAVEYEWNGNWYPATVLGTQDGQYKIHYKDWPEGRFELVPPSRVRAGAGQPPAPRPVAPEQNTNSGNNSSATAGNTGPFKLGDIVETTSVPGDWSKRRLNAAKIIGFQDGEPRYKLRSLMGTDGSRDYFSYSEQVRRPQNAVYDDYDRKWFIGSWRIGTSTQNLSTVTGERDTSIGTEVTTRNETIHIAHDRVLIINGDHSYIWKPTSTETIKGNWVESDNPVYPITLKKAHGGDDWGVGPYGRHNGVYNIKVFNFAIGNTFWGPALGKIASVPPLIAAPANAAKAPATRWKVGDKVEYNINNDEWRKVTIIEVDNGKYKIHFDGALTDSYDLWTSEKGLRPRR